MRIEWAILIAVVSMPQIAEAQLRDGDKPFKFVDGGLRDPFTFVKVTPPPTPPPPPPPRKTPFLMANAVKAFKDGRYAKAVSLCEEGLRSFAERPDDEMDMQLEEVRENLHRLLIASERLHQRQSADSAFRKLRLKLSGVVSSRRRGRAIVNGTVVRAGRLIQIDGVADPFVVERILPGALVVRYRGYNMELAMARN